MARIVFVAALVALAVAVNKGTFMHITDTHTQLDYKVGSDPSTGCWKGTGSAKKYGDYACRSPYIVEKGAFDLVAKLSEKIDFVLWTGDATATLKGEYTQEGITTMLKNVTSVFKDIQKRTGAKIFPMLGNHDAVPQHYCAEKDWWAYKVAADLWKDFLPASAIESYKVYARYTADINSKLRLIVINTVLYYHHNKLVANTTADPAGQFAWIKQQLAKARADGKKVFVAGHIPPGRMRAGILLQWSDKLVDVFDGYHDIIKGSWWGHFHADIFNFVGNAAKNNFHTCFQAGNVGSDNKHNPSFRVFDYNRDTGDVLDFSQYYFDVATANSKNKDVWAKRYQATKFYGIADCTAPNMYKAFTKLKGDTALFNKMYTNLWGGNAHTCTGSCRTKKLCFMLYPHEADYQACVKKGI